MSRRTVEIESLDDWDSARARTDRLSGWFVQSVDLSDRSASVRATQPSGGVFLGCTFAPDDEHYLRAAGALVFPTLPDLPFNPYRSTLYSAHDLYGDAGYQQSLDGRSYSWFREPHDLAATLAMSLHDHAVSDALDEATEHLDPSRVVGVMGGHAMQRGEPAYAGAALLGRDLTRAGRTVLTGGGPGAMEAANLGAWLARHDDAAVEQACALLADVPSFRPDIDAWVSRAFEVRERWPDGADSIGIPTWFYGHEPPNVFGTEIAKYFANALREDTLLHRCRGGIIYLDGAAGTVQEIFQAVTENYYAADPALIAPLVLVGVEHWTDRLPAWPLLSSLAAGRPMESSIHLVDSVAEALDVLQVDLR